MDCSRAQNNAFRVANNATTTRWQLRAGEGYTERGGHSAFSRGRFGASYITTRCPSTETPRSARRRSPHPPGFVHRRRRRDRPSFTSRDRSSAPFCGLFDLCVVPRRYAESKARLIIIIYARIRATPCVVDLRSVTIITPLVRKNCERFTAVESIVFS